ncbi:MAG: hypothetical protein R3C24_00580 [Cyanobacteriota/Melainabacteria group bacterium]
MKPSKQYRECIPHFKEALASNPSNGRCYNKIEIAQRKSKSAEMKAPDLNRYAGARSSEDAAEPLPAVSRSTLS